jgi:hypothetical protein
MRFTSERQAIRLVEKHMNFERQKASGSIEMSEGAQKMDIVY